MEEGESLVTSAGKAVDFQHLALAVPIRLQNETTCTRDISSTQQKIINSKLNYTSKVDEKQFSGVQRDPTPKSPRSKFTVVGLCMGIPNFPYFAAPSLHVQSMPQNSTELQMPQG